MVKQVNILGTTYKITVKKYTDEAIFKESNISGYCDMFGKNIVLCDPKTWPIQESTLDKSYYDLSLQETCRHEIVHAYLYESGLDANSNDVHAWATNEEFVDWLAIQAPKIFKTFKDAGLI